MNGPEGIPEKGMTFPVSSLSHDIIRLSPTSSVVLKLAGVLRDTWSDRKFHLFLDNLFLNVPVARALLFLKIVCTDTTRKNASGIPKALLDLKERNNTLMWNSTCAEIIEGVLCFL